MRNRLRFSVLAVAALAVPTSASAQDVPALLSEAALYLPMDTVEGGDVVDGSSFAATPTTNGNVERSSGVFGEALSFGGLGSYIAVPYEPQFENLRSFTVAAWVKLNVKGGSHTILSTRHPADGYFDLKIFQDSVYADVGQGDSWIVTGLTIGPYDTGSNGEGGNIAEDTWHHVACVVDDDAKTITMYLNGDLKRTYAYPSSLVPQFMGSSSIITVGSTTLGQHELLDGMLDELSVFGRALSSPELKALASVPAQQAPVLQLEFDALATGGALDTSRFEQHGAVHGTIASAPGVEGNAVALEGDGGDYLAFPYSAQFGQLHSFSVSAWVKVGVSGRSETILSTRHPTEAGFDLKIHQNSLYADVGDGSQFVLTGVAAGSADTGSNGESGPVPVNIWQHVACVVDNQSKTISLYLNGDLKKSVSFPAERTPLFLSPSSIVVIGSSNDGRHENFGGTLDDLLVFNRALTAGEIADLSVVPQSAPSAEVTMQDIEFSSFLWQPAPDEATTALLAAVENYGLFFSIEPIFWPFALPGGAGLYAILTADTPGATEQPVVFLALWSPEHGAHVVPPGFLDVYLSQNGVIRDSKPYDSTVLPRAVEYWGYPASGLETREPGTSQYELDNPNAAYPAEIGLCQRFVPAQLPQELYPRNPYLELVPRELCTYTSRHPTDYGQTGVMEWPRRRCPALDDLYQESGGTTLYCTTEDGRLSELQPSNDGIPAACTSLWGYLGNATCAPEGQATVSGTVTPKFMVTRVIYAPPGSEKEPGTDECPNRSVVTYTDASKNMTSIGIGQTFKEEREIKASVMVGGMLGGLMVMKEVSESGETSDTSMMEAVSEASLNRPIPGPCKNGLDHNFDLIYIIVSPEVQMTVHTKDNCAACSAQEEKVDWTFGNGGVGARVPVGELRSFLPEEVALGDTMTPSVWLTDLFEGAGIGAPEVREMLSANPLWNHGSGGPQDAAALDEQRFIRVLPGEVFHYNTQNNSPSLPDVLSLNETLSNSNTRNSKDEKRVAFSVDATAKFAAWMSVSFSSSNSWAWSNMNSSSNRETITTGGSLSLGSPGPSYPSDASMSLAVYLDTVYRTFAFVPL